MSPAFGGLTAGNSTPVLHWDPNDLLAQLWAWQNADISANEIYGGDLANALGSIQAKALIMPGEADLYFRVADGANEMKYLGKAELRPIPSIWGHLAGIPISPEDGAFLAKGDAVNKSFQRVPRRPLMLRAKSGGVLVASG
jgi:homoserine O-acetyltransferase/O-succinyltransferase